METSELFRAIWAVSWRLGLILLVFGAGSYLLYFLVSIPLRRRERARLFLDLIETSIKAGQTPERWILNIAETRDLSVSVRFHLVAARIEAGESLAQAIENTPRLLPPKISGMLRAGLQTGQLERVLPACQELLEDSHSQIRKAQSHLLTLGFITTPAACYVALILSIWVIPKFRDIFQDMEVERSPWMEFLLNHQGQLLGAQFAILGLLIGSATIYLGGPRVMGWIGRVSPTLMRLIYFKSPWERRRGQRDFSAMLAILLDSGMSEAQAVQIAATAVANPVILDRAERVRADLQQGRKLTDALRHIDDAGEFKWRLENAARGQGRFQQALAGWQDALDAKAFQLEQSATQVASTALVLLNGAIVAFVVVSLFHPLIQLVNGASLW